MYVKSGALTSEYIRRRAGSTLPSGSLKHQLFYSVCCVLLNSTAVITPLLAGMFNSRLSSLEYGICHFEHNPLEAGGCASCLAIPYCYTSNC